MPTIPQLRSFFPRKTGVEPTGGDAANQKATDQSASQTGLRSPALSIKSSREEPNEYKMSVVNDSGVYLPPSPTEKKSFWHRSPHSTTSSNHRSLLNENEPFSISRESFESYRRSFDISARSPVSQQDGFPTRASLESRTARLPRSGFSSSTFEKPRSTQEEVFEDVGLNDEVKPKRKSFLSRFGETVPETSPSGPENTKPSSSHHGFHLPGRRRGQSGAGAELGNIERPVSKGKSDVVVR